MARNKTNFDIVNYVHLTYGGAKDDNRLKSKSNSNFAKDRIEKKYEELENSFKRELGLSSKQFLDKEEEFQETVELINSFFNSDNFETINGGADVSQIGASLGISLAEATSLLASSKVHGYSNILGKLFTESGKELEETINSLQSYFQKTDIYKNILNSLNSKAGSKNRELEALKHSLISEIIENANIAKDEGKNSSVFSGSFIWQDTAYDNIKKDMDEIANYFGGDKTLFLNKLEKINSKLRKIINQQIKGKSTGEFSSGIAAKALVVPILNSVVGTINTEIQHTGTEKGIEKSLKKDFQKVAVYKGKGAARQAKTLENFSKSFLNFMTHDAKMDILIKYNDREGSARNAKISTKRYKLGSYGITLASNLSLGAILAFSNSETIQDYYLGNNSNSARLFNALNFYLLGDIYGVNNGKIITKKGKGVLTDSEIDSQFNGILSSFMIDVLSIFLEPTSNVFLDVNGIIIPTPVYYKYMMDRFLNSKKSTVSSYIKLNRSSFKSETNEVFSNPNIAQAEEIKPGKYNYAHPALRRHAWIREKIINHKINVVSNFKEIFSFTQYRNEILKKRSTFK